MAADKEPVAVLGAGRLGLCWALCAEAAGHPVVCADIFPSYVEAINARTLVSHEPDVGRMLAAATRLRATTSVAEAAASARVLYVFVQTPSSGGERHYDHSHLNDVLGQLNALRVRDKHVVIGCTVMPGYCAQVAPALLRDCTRVTVSYSPAFIAQGEIVRGLLAPDLVLVGATDAYGSAGMLEGLHRSVLQSPAARAAQCARHGSTEAARTPAAAIRRMSPASAEVAKLALNCFVTLKIAFANFIGDVADATDRRNREVLGLATCERHPSSPPTATCSSTLNGSHAPAPGAGPDAAGSRGTLPEAATLDKAAILDALGCDERVGPKCLRPGYGFGGPCFPRDNRALGAHAAQVGLTVCLPDATDAANAEHAREQAADILRRLAAIAGHNQQPVVASAGTLAFLPGLAGGLPPVVFTDVAFKPNCPVPIVQESQKLLVARLVRNSGVRVIIRDRPAVLDQVRRDHGLLFEYEEVAATAAAAGPHTSVLVPAPGAAADVRANACGDKTTDPLRVREATIVEPVDADALLFQGSGVQGYVRSAVAGRNTAEAAVEAACMEDAVQAAGASSINAVGTDGTESSSPDAFTSAVALAAEMRGEGRRSLPVSFTQ